MCANVRELSSRDMIMLNTRVTSARNASAVRSNISFVCSSKRSGMPSGRSGSSMSSGCDSEFWMRCSTSRTDSRYSPSFTVSPEPSSAFTRLTSARSESRMLPWLRMRAWRASALPPSPNSRSKTTRGCDSVGFGVVAFRHDTVLT